MQTIDQIKVQKELERYLNKDVYVHMETTNGAYASHHNENTFNVGVFIRNAKVRYHQAKIIGDSTSYRIGLKTENGWIYAEGVREYEINQEGQLLIAGHDQEGRLLVTLEISETPFKNES